MELSESVQRGLQSLADPSAFDQSCFQVLVDVSFRSLLSSRGDPGVLGEPPPLPPPPPPTTLLSPRLLPVSLRGESVDKLPRCLWVFICSPANQRSLQTDYPLQCLCEGSAPRRGGSAADSRPSAAGAKAMLASCAACFTCSSTHTTTRPLGVPFVI